MPAGHGEHELVLVPEYCPATQLAHAELADDAEYLPAAQLAQAVLVAAALNRPAMQLAHAVVPAAAWYVPTAQLVQLDDAEATEKWPAAHSSQNIEPVTDV